ncbi:MAG: sigma-70 family RNA polymerase sigma factor [Ruminococcaceae bacterium]|nr:sigma-70 family RNA polymerase sigma factor [Oscillospiraceae bacterium]
MWQQPSVEQVFLQYRQTVYRLALARLGNSAAAEDAVQEVFLRYVRKAPVFREAEHCKAWLLRVTVNCCRSARTTAWARHTVPLEDTLTAPPIESLGVFDAVQTLPPAQRVVIHLFYYEGYSVREIAQMTSATEATVKTRLHRARTALRNLLDTE